MLKSECHWDPSTASFHRQEPFDAPQQLLFSVGKELRLLNLFLPPSALFWGHSISSFHRRQRPEAPQFLLFLVRNILMPLTRIHNRKITHFSADTIITTEKSAQNNHILCDFSIWEGFIRRILCNFAACFVRDTNFRCSIPDWICTSEMDKEQNNIQEATPYSVVFSIGCWGRAKPNREYGGAAMFLYRTVYVAQ